MGINLHSANRVVIVDGSWDPTYDLQAIYRAWRYGQKKPVFAYRLMANGTMEEKIYERQVKKEGLAARVVDRQQIHRTISREEMFHLFEFGDEDNPHALSEFGQKDVKEDNQNLASQSGNPLKQKTFSHGSCSSNKLMENLLSKHHPRLVEAFLCLSFHDEMESEELEVSRIIDIYCGGPAKTGKPKTLMSDVKRSCYLHVIASNVLNVS